MAADISSPKIRGADQFSDEFEGLAEDAKRFELLKLVKRVGAYADFTSKMVQLLEYYLVFTKDCDWKAGNRAIVYQALSKTAVDFGVSERQIQKLERALFEVGAIAWNDSGNHRRYGSRDAETGEILYAYGVDLSPLTQGRVLTFDWRGSFTEFTACGRAVADFKPGALSLEPETEHNVDVVVHTEAPLLALGGDALFALDQDNDGHLSDAEFRDGSRPLIMTDLFEVLFDGEPLSCVSGYDV